MANLEGQLALGSLVLRFHDNVNKVGRQNLTAGMIKGRIELLEKYWTRFQERHEELLQESQQSEVPYFAEDYYGKVETAYSDTLGYLYDLQLAQPPAQEILRVDRRPATNTNMVRLPKISLPMFKGSYEEWESFRDLFLSIIHSNEAFNAVQKLHYLKASVEGEAKVLLDSVSTTGANYETAWDLLLKRYNNKKILLNHHLTQIVMTPSLRRENASDLRILVDRFAKTRAVLAALECPIEQWDIWFVFFMVRSLDPTTRADWEKQTGMLQRLSRSYQPFCSVGCVR